MNRSTRIVRCSRIALAASIVTLLAGCGAVLTAGIAGGVLALGGGKSGSGGATPTTVNSAAVVGDTSTGTVQFVFTISNASSSNARVEVRFSVTPQNGTEDDATLAFPTRALPAPAGLATASPSATSVANDADLAASPGGTAYTFLWNTSQDLGAFLYNTSVRLQLLIDGQVAFTVSPFTVDNTVAPQVVSVTLPNLAPGATEYADAFGGNRGIPIAVTIADANADNVALTVLYSTDGGGSFPATNVAAGNLVDPASGTIVPINSVTTTQGGKAYTFVFASASNGLGTTTDQQNLALQFTAATTKRGTARASAVFAVDNVAFSAAPGTPSGTEISDIVDFGYLLTEGAGQPLDVQIEYSVDGGLTFTQCTELKQPPSQGTSNLTTAPQGAGHAFVWNAYQDLLVGRNIPALANAVLAISPIRRSTQVTAGPFRSRPFTIDQRLIYTIFSRQAGVTDGVAAGVAQLTVPEGVAVLAGNVYFADTATNRVRVVPQSGGAIETFFGGGEDTSDGALATDYALLQPTDIAADPVPPGALFVCGSVDIGSSAGPVTRLFRVDGSTPIVTTLFDGAGASVPYAVCYEPKNQTVYFALNNGHVEIWSVPPDGSSAAKFVAGQAPTGSNTSNDAPIATAVIDVAGLAANFNIYPGLVFFTERKIPRVRALDVDAAPRSFGATSVPAQSVKTLTTSFNAPLGISIEGKNAVDVTDNQADTIFRISETLAVTPVCGSQTHGFNGDGFAVATQAKLLTPTRICGDLLGGSDPLHPSVGFFFSDTGNVRVRQVEPSQIAPINTFVHTFAGTTRDMGDTLPCATAQLDHPASLLALNGAVIVADTFVGRVRSITTQSTIIGTLAGNGTSGDTGDGGLSINATTGGPIGLVAGVNSAIYFSQFNESVIRKIVPSASGPVIQHVAGVSGSPGVPVDGQPAATQPLLLPRALAFAGNCIVVTAWDDTQSPSLVFAINDTATPQVCAGVTVPAGAIKLIAGGGALAPPISPATASGLGCQLGGIEAVTANRSGGIYIADVTSHCVYQLDASGKISVLAGIPDSPGSGGDGGPANAANLNKPDGLGVEEPLERVLYVLDAGNDSVRAINVSSAPVTVHGVTINAGDVNRVAGGNGPGFTGDQGLASSAQLFLSQVTLGSNIAAVDSTLGPILVFPDIGNSRIRTVDPIGVIRTYAGGGPLDGDATALQPAKTPENCNATFPTALAVQPDGTYYLMDLGRVRRVNSDDSTQKRLAGTAQQLPGLDGLSLNTSFDYYEASGSPKTDVLNDLNGPRALVHHTINGVGVLLIADTLGSRVRVMNLDSTATVTPNGMPAIGPLSVGTVPFSPPLTNPEGVALVSSGILLVSDTGANELVGANFTNPSPVTIRGSSVGGTTTSTIVLAPGVYSAANVVEDLDAPQNIAYDSTTDMVVVISEGGSSNSASPYAMSLSPANGQSVDRWGATIPIGGQPKAVFSFFSPNAPRGCALDPTTFDLYYADRGNQFVIRCFANNSGDELVAGNGAAGFKGDGGVAKQAELRDPIGVGVDNRGSIYILDGGNFKVRRCRNFP